MVCRGCGVELPPKKRPSGRDRKWCSSRCRKRTLYAGVCSECGGPTNGSNGPEKAATICGSCFRPEVKWTRDAIVAAINLWADEHGGVPPVATDWNVAHARAQGMDKPDRDPRFPLVPTVQERFGSWNAAIKAAGFEPFESGHYGRLGDDPAAVAEMVELYRSGLTLMEVGERVGLRSEAVRANLVRAGEPRRSRGSRSVSVRS